MPAGRSGSSAYLRDRLGSIPWRGNIRLADARTKTKFQHGATNYGTSFSRSSDTFRPTPGAGVCATTSGALAAAAKNAQVRDRFRIPGIRHLDRRGHTAADRWTDVVLEFVGGHPQRQCRDAARWVLLAAGWTRTPDCGHGWPPGGNATVAITLRQEGYLTPSFFPDSTLLL